MLDIVAQRKDPTACGSTPSPPSGVRHIPDDIRACLTPDQIARLEQLGARKSTRAIDYQVSTSCFGRRFYLALFAGSETRSDKRLRDEGLRQPLWTLLVNAGLVCIPATVLICCLTGGTVISLYVLKSFLGIDLFEGPSFLHDYVFWK